ncbi:NADH-quinone oxidoreductase subunit M [Allostreptomyces psammosilenae]|uniref:NADH-quinone oxidoreductase subunit M n=1 Tax=Allostreptomyces psammosilenae TaxID=1892865 RepID=A0A853A568_9ACTN|nr:NADH-quinone oxidoreductase subunit M [Allostreptomyces psammosilenae]NYI05841.1 NADH-quinone oxidoreductase subunit M [Allostreptomyces psammosilenae]
MEFPLLTVTAALPAVGALVVAATPARRAGAARWTALAFSLGTLLLAAAVALRFDPGGDRYQLVESHTWIPAFGTRYQLGVDGVGVVLIALTAVLVPLVIAAAWRDADTGADADGETAAAPATATGTATATAAPARTSRYLALMLLVEAMVVMAFAATDVFLFYVFFEAMLIPMYFLIGGFGDRTRQATDGARTRAAVKFLLYNLLGGLVMLAAVVGLYAATARAGLGQDGGGTFDLPAITAAVADGTLALDPTVERALFLGFMFAFAVKAPLWPLHTWLPGAMGESTPATAVLITAVVDKVGTFAMLRYCLQLFPEASAWATPVVLTLAVISILYGALAAIAQTDLKRLVAYASVSHFGFIVLGVFALTSQGISGAALYMVNHGVSTAALMLIIGFLITRRGSRLIADFGGVQKVAPVLAGTFLVAGLATLSMPGLAPFVSEFLVLVGTFSSYPVAGAAATVGIVLAALYVLIMYQRTMTGPLTAKSRGVTDLRARELAVVTPLVALLLVLGVYPKPVLDVIDPAVGHTMSDLQRTDPAPEVPVADSHTAGGAR